MDDYLRECEERSVTEAEMERDLEDAEWVDDCEAVADWLDVAERAWRDTLTPEDRAALAEQERIEREMERRHAARIAATTAAAERGREMAGAAEAATAAARQAWLDEKSRELWAQILGKE
jgi:hypothetical protein